MTTALVPYNDYNSFRSNVHFLCKMSRYYNVFRNAGHNDEAIRALDWVMDTLESMLWDLKNIRFWRVMGELEA